MKTKVVQTWEKENSRLTIHYNEEENEVSFSYTTDNPGANINCYVIQEKFGEVQIGRIMKNSTGIITDEWLRDVVTLKKLTDALEICYNEKMDAFNVTEMISATLGLNGWTLKYSRSANSD